VVYAEPETALRKIRTFSLDAVQNLFKNQMTFNRLMNERGTLKRKKEQKRETIECVRKLPLHPVRARRAGVR
jgi:hypothetical protein